MTKPVQTQQNHILLHPKLSWQDQLKQMITTTQELLSIVELDQQPWLSQARMAEKQFPVRTTHAFAQRIKKNDPDDPLLAQILPLAAEVHEIRGLSGDPLAEAQSSPIPGLIHKYENRILLIGASACAINCRYCFRREYPYADHRISPTEQSQILEYIQKRPAIDEVILSGGDPLMTNDARFEKWLQKLEDISHLKRLRIHSRLPIVLPDRITPKLVQLLTETRLQSILVIHSNHPQEFDNQVISGLIKLRQSGVLTLNQSVLLKGINDQVDTLIALSETLIQAQVLPYYLHLLDPVKGADHFRVEDDKAVALMKGMLSKTSGFMVPKLVREVPGQANKTLIPIA